MSAATKQEWYTTAEACEYARVSRRTIVRCIANGTLRPDSRKRTGCTHRFRRATLDAWLTGEAANDG